MGSFIRGYVKFIGVSILQETIAGNGVLKRRHHLSGIHDTTFCKFMGLVSDIIGTGVT